MSTISRSALLVGALVAVLIVLSAAGAVTASDHGLPWAGPSAGIGQATDGTLRGIVKNIDNVSVPNAQVVLSQDSQLITSMSTGSDGSFEFEEPAGTYNLTIDYTGYEVYTRNVTLVEGQTLDLGFIMLTPLPNYFWILMDIIMVVGALSIFLVVGKRVRKL